MKSSADLAALVRQRTWDKELVLWVGSESALRKALALVPVETLDLLDLFDETDLPADDGETRERLVHGLREELQTYRSGPELKIVLVLKSVGLLTRCRAGVRELYDWFLGDFAMAVLLLEASVDDVGWPEEVHCDPDRLLESFTVSASVKAVYGEMA